MKATLTLEGMMEYQRYTKGSVGVRFMGGDFVISAEQAAKFPPAETGELKKIVMTAPVVKKGGFGSIEFRASEVLEVK